MTSICPNCGGFHDTTACPPPKQAPTPPAITPEMLVRAFVQGVAWWTREEFDGSWRQSAAQNEARKMLSNGTLGL